MATIKLAKAWTYRTPQVTMDFGAGTHEVTEVVRRAALAAGAITEEEGRADGNGSAKTGPARAGNKAQG